MQRFQLFWADQSQPFKPSCLLMVHVSHGKWDLPSRTETRQARNRLVSKEGNVTQEANQEKQDAYREKQDASREKQTKLRLSRHSNLLLSVAVMYLHNFTYNDMFISSHLLIRVIVVWFLLSALLSKRQGAIQRGNRMFVSPNPLK